MPDGTPSTSSDWGGYSAAAAGGATVGAVFPIVLFDKLGVGALLSNQSTFSSAVYAITIFAMVAMIVLATGAVVLRAQVVGGRSLLNIVLAAFMGVFFLGFLYFIYSAAMKPGITVQISFDDYDRLVSKFQHVQLSPYVYSKEKMAFIPTTTHKLIVTGDTPINFGMDNLVSLEDRYVDAISQLRAHRFDNKTMGEICQLPKYRDNPVCSYWQGEGMSQ